MAFKDQFMWEQVVFSIGKHFMAMGPVLCPAYLRLPPHPAHGVAAALVAAPPRSPLKIPQTFTETQNGKSLMLQSLTSGRLIVSLVIEAIGFRQIVN